MTAADPSTKMPLVCWQSVAMMGVEVKIPLSATASDVGDLERSARSELLIILHLDARRTASLPQHLTRKNLNRQLAQLKFVS